jgi:hypothetical protein
MTARTRSSGAWEEEKVGESSDCRRFRSRPYTRAKERGGRGMGEEEGEGLAPALLLTCAVVIGSPHTPPLAVVEASSPAH